MNGNRRMCKKATTAKRSDRWQKILNSIHRVDLRGSVLSSWSVRGQNDWEENWKTKVLYNSLIQGWAWGKGEIIENSCHLPMAVDKSNSNNSQSPEQSSIAERHRHIVLDCLLQCFLPRSFFRICLFVDFQWNLLFSYLSIQANAKNSQSILWKANRWRQIEPYAGEIAVDGHGEDEGNAAYLCARLNLSFHLLHGALWLRRN